MTAAATGIRMAIINPTAEKRMCPILKIIILVLCIE
jgi:hypothetical protein